MNRIVLFSLALSAVACSSSDAPEESTQQQDADTEVGCVPQDHAIDLYGPDAVEVRNACDTYTLTLLQDTGIYLEVPNASDMHVLLDDGTSALVETVDGDVLLQANLSAGTYVFSFPDGEAEGAWISAYDVCEFSDTHLVNGSSETGTIGDGECLSRGVYDNYVLDLDTPHEVQLTLHGAWARADVYRGHELITSVMAGGQGFNGVTTVLDRGVYDVRVALDGNPVQYNLDVQMTDVCEPVGIVGAGDTVHGDRRDSDCDAASTFDVEANDDAVFVATRAEPGTELWHRKGNAVDYPLYAVNRTWFQAGDQIRVTGEGEFAIATSTLTCTTDFFTGTDWHTVNISAGACNGVVRIPVWGIDGVQRVETYGRDVDETRLLDANGNMVDGCQDGCPMWVSGDELMFVEVRGRSIGQFGFRMQ